MPAGRVALVVLIGALAVAGSADAALAAEPTLWSRTIGWLLAQQRTIQNELTEALRAIDEGGGMTAAWTLVIGSAIYGVVHAAGPGHGKAVLTTYLLTHRERLRSGIFLAAAAAFTQGLVALILVYGLIYIAGWLPRDTSAAVDWSERMSYALVAGIGGFLVWRAAHAIWRRWRKPTSHVHAHAHHHAHGHHHVGHDHHHHHHDPDDPACDCGHMPTAEQMDLARDFRTSLGVILSIGLRPCSGAVLVLVFARTLGLPWAGVAAVAAMSAGTAIAVMSLAFLAVNARDLAVRVVGADNGGGSWFLAAHGVALLGGAILIAIGASLMAASFATPHPLAI